MNRLAMQSLARKHWAIWLPKKTAALKKAGELNEAIQGAALAAEREIEALMKQGAQEHEAEEIVLPLLILLPPEPGANQPDWEKEELAALERQHCKEMGPLR